jgi:hypothetical protein
MDTVGVGIIRQGIKAAWKQYTCISHPYGVAPLQILRILNRALEDVGRANFDTKHRNEIALAQRILED